MCEHHFSAAAGFNYFTHSWEASSMKTHNLCFDSVNNLNQQSN